MTFVRVTRDRGVARVELDRPPLNVLSIAMMSELTDALLDVEDENVILLTGRNGSFSAGMDIGEHLPPAGEKMLEEVEALFTVIDRCPVPLVAWIQRLALGGGFELALACDFAYAEETARIGLPEIKLGVFPPVAAAILPPAVAREFILVGDEIPPARALHMGLLAGVGPLSAAESRALALAERPRAALVAARTALRPPDFSARLDASLEAYTEGVLHDPEALRRLQARL